MAKSLPKARNTAMARATKRGREAWKRGDLAEAEAAFLEGWAAIPEPQLDYDYGQIMARGLADFFRDTGQSAKAYEWLEVVRRSYPDPENPSVAFLAGTIALAAGNEAEAFALFDDLHKRFGTRPFQGKDPKYLTFYQERSTGKRKS